MATFSIAPYYSVEIDIDGQPLRLQIKRMTRAEIIAFRSGFSKTERASRKIDMLVEHEAKKIGAADETGMRQLASLDVEAPAAALRVDQEIQKLQGEVDAFMREALASYVSVPGGQLSDGPDLTGDALITYFGGRDDVFQHVLAHVLAHNTMAPRQKKAFLSAFGSVTGSDDKTPVPPGDAPGTTAPSVEPKDSAPLEAAMAVMASASSGSMPESS